MVFAKQSLLRLIRIILVLIFPCIFMFICVFIHLSIQQAVKRRFFKFSSIFDIFHILCLCFILYVYDNKCQKLKVREVVRFVKNSEIAL